MKEYLIQYGRLGNLLFQFAHIYTLIESSEDKEYSINQLPVNIEKLEYKPTKFSNSGYWPGYCESENYFNPSVIRKIYKPSNIEKDIILNKYEDLTNSLFISVRRGDFLTFKDTFICLNANYYNDMYNKLLQMNRHYDKIFLSTDVYEWCKENINIPNIIYLENETPINTVWIASLCKDFIISSSTFSWWCAWVGEQNGGIIISPDKHFHSKCHRDELNDAYIPDRWCKQDVEALGYCE